MRIAFLFLAACGSVSSSSGLFVTNLQVHQTTLDVRRCELRLDVEHRELAAVLFGGPSKSSEVGLACERARTEGFVNAVEDGAR